MTALFKDISNRSLGAADAKELTIAHTSAIAGVCRSSPDDGCDLAHFISHFLNNTSSQPVSQFELLRYFIVLFWSFSLFCLFD
jgi:hypothetical protein